MNLWSRITLSCNRKSPHRTLLFWTAFHRRIQRYQDGSNQIIGYWDMTSFAIHVCMPFSTLTLEKTALWPIITSICHFGNMMTSFQFNHPSISWFMAGYNVTKISKYAYDLENHIEVKCHYIFEKRMHDFLYVDNSRISAICDGFRDICNKLYPCTPPSIAYWRLHSWLRC
jgi:hypothetical protein